MADRHRLCCLTTRVQTFVILINAMPFCVSPHTRNALFADAKFYTTISSIDDQAALQNDLYALNNWSKTWDIEFMQKNIWCFRSKLVNVTMLLSLLSVASQNDLGIMATNNLKRRMLINQMICKSNI